MAATSLFEMAVRFHRAGQVDRAEALYRDVIARAPEHGDAMFLLSVLAVQSGRLAEAARLLERAVEVAPNNPVFPLNLGNVYRRLGRTSQAASVLLVAIARKPDFAEAVFSLALTFEEQGALDAAVACYERALQLEPKLAHAAEQLSIAKGKAGRESQQVAARAPSDPETSARAAEGLAALGETLRLCGRRDDALAWWEAALRVNPQMAAVRAKVGALYGDAGRFDEAIEAFRLALELDASQDWVSSLLATALDESGRLAEAEEQYRRAVAAHPEDPDAHSALLFNMPFWPNVTQRDILVEARAYNARHVRSLAARAMPHENERSPERRLRVGYVSPDFRSHVQSLFTVPLLQNHDHERFEIFCYSSAGSPDKLTERIRGYADAFREVRALDDAALAKLVRNDRVDVLVDLTMHMTDRRLLAFARRPAPVQVCWLAYPGTTGVETMDYRISDPHLDPPGADLSVYSEKTVRLPDSFWCYDPLTDEPDVSPLPALREGRIRFGCLNHFKKVNDGVLRVWARVLAAVPESRLTVMVPLGSARKRVRSVLEAEKIDPDRVEFVERCGRLGYLARYREIDICLDTFPSNGHTTSLDAFWMGVPTVTLAGDTVVGRAGVCQAMNLELPELIATTPEHYVSVATSLAGDLERLAKLRLTLRERMKRSPLMDSPRFARNLEAAYRELWARYCARG